MQENLGAHILWHLPVLGAVHADTIVTTWIVMALSLAFFAWVGASYRRPTQTKRQVVVEGVVNYVADLATSTLGKRGEPFVPFFIALFVFIFLLNQFGMLPFKALGLPVGGSPTADLNTTVPLALTVWLATWVLFPKTHAKHLVQPFAWLLPINLIEEFSRPLTLAARLFFNIFVGELLFLIVASGHRRAHQDRRAQSLVRGGGRAVLHPVFQLLRRHRPSVRFYPPGDRLLLAGDRR